MNFTKLHACAFTPTRKHPTDAGLDLYACLSVNDVPFRLQIEPHSFALVPTEIAVEIPPGCCGQVWPKSRNDYLIGGGIVDSGYTGQILVKVMNTSDIMMEIRHGDAIGQLVITPVFIEELFEKTNEAFYLKKTERGDTGGIATQYKQTTFLANITDVS